MRDGSDGSFAVSFRKGSTVNHRLVADLGQLGLDRKKLVPPTEKPGPTTLSSEHTSQLRNSPAYHGNINRAKSEELLNGKPEGAFLLREGRGRVVALSRVAGGKIEHWLMDSEDAFAMARDHMQKFRTQRVTA